jgi:hypothetical protein
MGQDQMTAVREHLLYVLHGGGAHLDFDHAIAGLPADLRDVKPAGLTYSRLAAGGAPAHSGRSKGAGAPGRHFTAPKAPSRRSKRTQTPQTPSTATQNAFVGVAFNGHRVPSWLI